MNPALACKIPRRGAVCSVRRLLFVVNDAGFFLSHRLCIARAARQEGFEVHVAVPQATDQKRISMEGFLVHSIPLARRSLNPLRDLKTCISLFRLFRRVNPDIVHTVTIKPVIYGGIAARLAQVPAVVSAISGMGYVFIEQGQVRRMLLRRLILILYRFALAHPRSQVIFQNRDDYALFIRNHLIRNQQAVLIRGSGVDVTLFTPKPEPSGMPLVILASRMLWDKGVGEFVKAATNLREQGLEARFALVGRSDPDNPTSISIDQLRSWHNEGFVEWWGQREDMPRIFAECHIVCLPSYREGLPKVLLEAAACGRPIVASDEAGCREIVRHGQNGLLVPSRNAMALAEAIKMLVGNSEMRQKMGREGCKMVQQEFTEDLVVEKTLSLYAKFFPTIIENDIRKELQ